MLYITVSENAVFEGSSGSLWLPSAMSRVYLKSIFCWRFEFSIKGYRNRYLKIITTEVVICEANTSNGVVCMCACVCVCVCSVVSSRSFEISGPRDSFSVVYSLKISLEVKLS